MTKFVYKLKEAAHEHPAGTIVYECAGYDYGCARDDTMYTGILHRSMTLSPDGEYPFFTVPVKNLEEV